MKLEPFATTELKLFKEVVLHDFGSKVIGQVSFQTAELLLASIYLQERLPYAKL